jgi:hypothetical protein
MRKRVLHFTHPTSIVKGPVLEIPKTKKFKWLVALEQVMEGAKICSSTTNSTLHQKPYLLHILYELIQSKNCCKDKSQLDIESDTKLLYPKFSSKIFLGVSFCDQMASHEPGDDFQLPNKKNP